VPRISEFFGIMIYMYWFDRQKHQGPHFHARFGGDLGPRANRLVVEWCQERGRELTDAWTAAISGREIPWVAPLR
jgi:hypothetical protein